MFWKESATLLKMNFFTCVSLWTHDVNWTYIRRSIYFLCLRGFWKIFNVNLAWQISKTIIFNWKHLFPKHLLWLLPKMLWLLSFGANNSFYSLAILQNKEIHVNKIDQGKGLTNNVSLFFISPLCYLCRRSLFRTNQTPKMGLFAEIVNGSIRLTIFAKCSI